MNLCTHTTFRSLALAGAMALAGSVFAAADTTYTISQLFGGASIGGTITTDGNSGTLSKSDIVSWDLIVTGQTGKTITLDSANSGLGITGNDLSASGTNLLFNFSGNDGGGIGSQLNGWGSSGYYYFCDATSNGACAAGESAVPTNVWDPTNSLWGYAESGEQVIGTTGGDAAAPEPSSLWLLGSGLFGFVGMVRRKIVLSV